MTHFHHKTKKPKSSAINRWIYVVAIIGPIMTIPQVLTIWVDRKVEGVSLLTWNAYIVLTIFWLYYGLVHKDLPVVFGNVLGLAVNIVIVAGLLVIH